MLSMSTPKVTKSADHIRDQYDVSVDGVKVGSVRKHVVHYNLTRAMVVRSWIAHLADGRKIVNGRGNESAKFRTRAEAVEAVVAHAAENVA